MRYAFLSLLLLVGLPARAATRYVSQAGGAFSGGTACNGQTAISVATFNGTSQSAGDVNWICGTLTAALTPTGSGTLGNPVSLLFDTGSGMQFAAVPTTGAIVITNLSYYLIDGGGGTCGYVGNKNVTCSVGFIASTANGSGLANQIASVAIAAGGTTGIEIRGLLIGPIYTHTSTSDTSQSPPGPVAISFPGAGQTSIHNNTIHDCAWCINGNIIATGAVITNNEVYNSDHGVGMGNSNIGVTISANHFHDWVNWDTTNNSFHHDGIHIFDGAAGVSGVTECGNLFDGDQGNNVTAAIYNEHSAGLSSIQNVTACNNVVIIAATRFSNVGWIAFWNTAGSGSGLNGAAYNNTIYGYYSPGNGSCFGTLGWNGMAVENNVFVSCQNLIGMTGFTSNGTIDGNAYQNISVDQGCGASCNTFTWKTAVDFASFPTWQTDCSCDAHALFDSLTLLRLNSVTGQPQTGSAVILAGLNLTSLGIPLLDVDFLGNARPNAGAWSIGAFNTQATVGVPKYLIYW